MANLGWMYGSGRGVAKDEAQAVAWMRKAASRGNADAKKALDKMEQAGSGQSK
jgi:TPR repeat protein